MRASELAVLYAVVGLGASITLAAYWRTMRPSLVDLAILALFWPLYGPFVLMRRPGAPAPIGGPGGPDLMGRLDVARQKIAHIDGLLARPEFDLSAALQRQQELQTSGQHRSSAAAAARVANIQRLRALRERFARELTEVDELLAQIEVQSELVALAGGDDDGARALVDELTHRIQGLDALAELEGAFEAPPREVFPS